LFNTRYALLAKHFGTMRSACATTTSRSCRITPRPAAVSKAIPFTAAYIFEPSTHWRFTLEWLSVHSTNANRQIYYGEAPLATESALTLAVRYALGAHR
jgi:hypothetical protein